jgi:hypothetical protein
LQGTGIDVQRHGQSQRELRRKTGKSVVSMSGLFKQLVRERIQSEEKFVAELESQMKEMDEYIRRLPTSKQLEMIQIVFLMGDTQIIIDASKRLIARFEKVLQGEVA